MTIGVHSVKKHGRTIHKESTAQAMEGEHYVHAGSGRLIERQSKGYSPKGCWANFTKFLNTVWMTKHTEDVSGEEYVRASLRELMVYLLFLLVICIVAFMMISPTMYYHKNAIKKLFTDKETDQGTYDDIKTMDDFWWWIKGPFLNGVYWETDVDGTHLMLDGSLKSIHYENKLIGRPRLRQLRVRNDSCKVPFSFEREIKQCYNIYRPEYEETESFSGNRNSSAWKYENSSVVSAGHHWGRVGSYDGGGYVQVLSDSKVNASMEIQDLFDGRWIDRATRVIFLDFTVYNANINLFCIVKIVFEFPVAGGIAVSSRFDSVKLLRYVSNWDTFVLILEFIFCAFLAYYIVEELIEICKHRLSYFTEFWNLLDVLVIAVALACITFSVLRYIEVRDTVSVLLHRPQQYAPFDYLAYLQSRFDDTCAIMIFISWIKVFKYISFNKTMSQMGTTLHRCAKDVGGFAVMFFIFFLAYAQLGFMIFGAQVRDFCTFYDAAITLLRTIMGDFDFHQLEKVDRLLGPIYFISYVFFVFFVLLNMFLAIINDTYVQVKEELKTKKNEFEIMDIAKKGYYTMMRKLNRKKNELQVVKSSLAHTENSSAVDYKTIRENLRIRGYKDAEIEQIFSRYDIDRDEHIEPDEILRIEHDIDEEEYKLEHLQEQLLDDETTVRKFDQDNASKDDFSVLNRRIDRMEHSLGGLLTDMDRTLEDISKLERKKEAHIEQCHFRVRDAKKEREEKLKDITKKGAFAFARRN